jgi:predicted PurR-regulated permease PerM
MNLGNAIGLTLLVACLFLLWNIRQILLLAFMAIVLANILNLLVTWLQHHHFKRSFAFGVAVALLLSGVVGIFGVIVPALTGQFRQLIALVPKGVERFWSQLQTLSETLDPSILRAFPDFNTLLEQSRPLLNQIAGRGLSVFYGTLGIFLSLLLVLALTLMILADPAPYRQLLIRIFPSFYRPRVRSILRQCDRDLRAWLKGIVFHMMIVTLLSWFGLLLLGIPLAFSLGILAGFLTFIPNLGPVISVILPLAIAVLEAPWKPWAVLLLYLWIYLLVQYFDRHPPLRILSVRSLNLFPAPILLAQIFFASVFGFLGLFLAVPLSIVGRVWIREAIIEDILDRWRESDRGK